MSRNIPYENIKVGDIYSFEHTFTKNDEVLFGELTKDTTPSDVVHGMLAAGFFSTLMDIYGPGPGCIYVTQTLQFRKPIFYGTTVNISGEVLDKSDSTKIITIKTTISANNEQLITGEAKIKI